MNTLMLRKGTKLLCYLPLTDDPEEHGTDFIEGNEYEITSADSNGFYITAEDGSDVLFETITDIKNIFMIE